MAIPAIPIMPIYNFVNGISVQVSETMLEEPRPHLNYPNVSAGDTFKVGLYDDHETGRWIDAVPFTATLEVVSTPRKGKILVIDRSKNIHYIFLPVDFVHLVQNTTIHNGIFSGTFDFVKKGVSFGIKLV